MSIPQLDAGSLIGIRSHLEIHDYMRPKRSYWETMHDSKLDFGDQSYSIVPGLYECTLLLVYRIGDPLSKPGHPLYEAM